MIDDCSFRLKHYKEVLQDMKKKYYFSTFGEYEQNKTKKYLAILRHDVDFNPELALKFAKIENELGIKATYFLRVNANYNLFSYNNYTILKKIEEMGHEVALHLVEGYGEIFSEDNREMILRQKKIIEAIIGKKVLGFSTHEPARMGQIITDAELGNLNLKYQAYSPNFTRDMKYISDSGGRWREGCFCNFIKDPEKYPKLCILTHPLWWFEKSAVENY